MAAPQPLTATLARMDITGTIGGWADLSAQLGAPCLVMVEGKAVERISDHLLGHVIRAEFLDEGWAQGGEWRVYPVVSYLVTWTDNTQSLIGADAVVPA